jgi:hypothetical protein
MPEKKPKELKTQCPECDADCTVTLDDDGDYEGSCDGCGLNVGRVLTKRRYDKAATKLAERENAKPKKEKRDPFA